MRIWGTTILLLVASVPLFNYADDERRTIGAAATLLAFWMIRSVSRSQQRNHDEMAGKLDAVVRALRRPVPSARTERAGAKRDAAEHDQALAAAQAAALLDRIQRDRKHRKA